MAKVIAFVPMTAKITPDTASYNLRYNNTRGMTVEQKLGGGIGGTSMISFSIAYFDMTFEIQ